MDAITWQRAQQIFDDAIQKPGGERAMLVSEACASDQELRAEVEKLLRAHEAAGDFLASPTVAPSSRTRARRTVRSSAANGAGGQPCLEPCCCSWVRCRPS